MSNLFAIGGDEMDFKECSLCEDFLSFFNNDEQAFRHTNFYHYTSLENVDRILKAKQIRLTALSKSANDLVEKDNYKKLGDNIFSLCFSTGTSECLPLWYLYSGIDGRGARIGLKKKMFRQLYENPVFILQEVESSYPYNAIGKPILLKTTDFIFQCRDILYIGKDSQKVNLYRVKYNGQVTNNLTKDIADKLQSEYQRFIKGLIWFYEKETRLQVEVTNKELLEPAKNYVVILKLDDVYDDISVRLAPEYEEIETEIFEKYDGIKDWAYKKLQTSEFAGQLHMGLKEKLCRECHQKMEDN